MSYMGTDDKKDDRMGMRLPVETQPVRTPAELVEEDTPQNGDVVNAESIKATLANALKILEKYGIQAPAGAAGLASSSINGLSNPDLQRITDQLASAERAASGAAGQRQVVDAIGAIVPFIGKKN